MELNTMCLSCCIYADIALVLLMVLGLEKGGGRLLI